MVVHSRNEALMCKVFPFSLGGLIDWMKVQLALCKSSPELLGLDLLHVAGFFVP